MNSYTMRNNKFTSANIIGIKSGNNSCYFVSCLQVLFCMKELWVNSVGSFYYELQYDIYINYQKSCPNRDNNNPIDAHKEYNIIVECNGYNGRQQDTYEVLNAILSNIFTYSLYKHLNNNINGLQIENPKDIYHILYEQKIFGFKKNNPHYLVSTKIVDTYILKLNIEDINTKNNDTHVFDTKMISGENIYKTTLDKDYWPEDEKIMGIEKAERYEKIDSLKHISKYLLVCITPYYRNSSNISVKIFKKYEIAQYITTLDNNYILRCLVIHSGDTINGGHYVTLKFDEYLDLWLINDSTIIKQTNKNLYNKDTIYLDGMSEKGNIQSSLYPGSSLMNETPTVLLYERLD